MRKLAKIAIALMMSVPAYIPTVNAEESVLSLASCNTANDPLTPNWGFAFDYEDSPIVLELDFFSNRLVDVEDVMVQKSHSVFKGTLTTDNTGGFKHHKLSIDITPEQFKKILKSKQPQVVLLTKTGAMEMPIPDYFIQCINNELKSVGIN